MAFKMKFSTEELKAPEAIPAGLYDVRFISFKPKKSSKGDSVNFNAKVEIINAPHLNDNQLVQYALLNNKIPTWIQDFVHSFGLEMEVEDDDAAIPGTWDADAASFDPSNVETWKYEGPLTGKTAIWEFVADLYNGKPTTRVNRFICAVDDCAVRFPEISHAAKMVKSA